MGKFDSGVKGYVTGVVTLYVHFPINWKDEADVSCKQCRFFRVTSRSCALNDCVCAYPEKYVAAECPLEEFVVNIEDELEGVTESKSVPDPATESTPLPEII